MKIKTSSATPVLLALFIIVLVTKHFYNPTFFIHTNVISDQEFWINIGDIHFLLSSTKILYLICPCLEAINNLGDYITTASTYLKTIGGFTPVLVVMTALLSYLGVIVFLEKFHAQWHKGEDVWTMCLDMWMLENIVIYLYNVVVYIIGDFLLGIYISSKDGPGIWIILIIPMFILGVLTWWGTFCYIWYVLLQFLVTFIIPYAVASIFSFNDVIFAIVFFVMEILLAQVGWHIWSGAVFDVLWKFCKNPLFFLNRN